VPLGVPYVMVTIIHSSEGVSIPSDERKSPRVFLHRELPLTYGMILEKNAQEAALSEWLAPYALNPDMILDGYGIEYCNIVVTCSLLPLCICVLEVVVGVPRPAME
jgi:hypothetical protein